MLREEAGKMEKNKSGDEIQGRRKGRSGGCTVQRLRGLGTDEMDDCIHT